MQLRLISDAIQQLRDPKDRAMVDSIDEVQDVLVDDENKNGYLEC